ncbi:MAG: hypothetical protein HYV20_03600, partial [Gemmatimonadetes bacterium]|nr:hypothetical protein [Gemmatimonadota bacterium]
MRRVQYSVAMSLDGYIADPKGGYGSDVHHTFVGFAPADDPRFVILVKLAKPTAVKHAADSTTVVFSRLAEFLLHYYQVPPDLGGSN